MGTKQNRIYKFYGFGIIFFLYLLARIHSIQYTKGIQKRLYQCHALLMGLNYSWKKDHSITTLKILKTSFEWAILQCNY